jgi:hypothetical protein
MARVGGREVRFLRAMFRILRWPVLLTYLQFAIENALWMVQPYSLGLAIDGLLRRSHHGPVLLVPQHGALVPIGVLRRANDTRMFNRIHIDIVTRLVLQQRRRDIEVPRLVARTALARADCSERYVQVALKSSFWMIGGLAILPAYDLSLVLVCAALILPAGLLNGAYARLTLVLSGGLHYGL